MSEILFTRRKYKRSHQKPRQSYGVHRKAALCGSREMEISVWKYLEISRKSKSSLCNRILFCQKTLPPVDPYLPSGLCCNSGRSWNMCQERRGGGGTKGKSSYFTVLCPPRASKVGPSSPWEREKLTLHKSLHFDFQTGLDLLIIKLD